jgi:asparagine synthase (glutamine-hydrolysing)
MTRLPREYAEERVRHMLEVLRHEDFYSTGVWAEESLGLYIGWVAPKGSFSDAMPLWSERRDITLVFSGEEFPDPRTILHLKEQGHDFDGTGASYLVHLYEEDPSFPAALNGRFHGIVVDRNRKSATLFNDRYGMHRLYYLESSDAFYFAAEAKSILAVVPETRNIDMQALGEFVSCGCTLENKSLFKGVSLLPGGASWVLRKGARTEKKTYFNPEEWENQEPLAPEAYYQELRQVFSTNLPRYFEGPERVAMSITGGLDTRMIMAWQKRAPGTLPCYTFGGSLRDCQDVSVGRQVARACGQTHEVIRVGEEFLADFPHYAERSVLLSDGCVDVGRAPDLYLNEKARHVATIRMSGVYGGEVLRGVRTFKPEEPLPGLFNPEFQHYIRQGNDTYKELPHRHPVSFAVFSQAPLSQSGILGLEQTQVSVRTPFLDNDFVRTVFRAPKFTVGSNEVCMRLIADGNRALWAIPTDRGVGGNGPRLLQAASHSALEFLFKAEYAYDIGMPQWLAVIDHVLMPLHLERLFLGRHKIFHFRLWYRDALASYVRETLFDSTSLSRPYLEKKGIESIVLGHVSGKQNYSSQIHQLLSLELVQRTLLNPSRYAGLAGSHDTFAPSLSQTPANVEPPVGVSGFQSL